MKKLLLSTALIGSLVSGAALAEIKFGGNVESVYRTGQFDRAADKKGTKDGLAAETNISVSSSKALNNGMTLTAGFELENGSDHQWYTTISSGDVSFGYGLDFGYNGVSYGIPIVGEGFHDVAGILRGVVNDDHFSSSTNTNGRSMYGGEVHDVAHFNLTVKGAGGNFGFNYAPSPSQGRSMGPDDTGGSAYEIGYVGSPVEGVSVVINRQNGSQKVESGTTGDFVVDNLGLTYSTGPFAIGIGQIRADNGATTNSDLTQTQYGATYSTDAFSVGIAKAIVDLDGQTVDEEHVLLTASYNFGGGLGIEIGYDQASDLNYTAGKDGTALQVRTLVKF